MKSPQDTSPDSTGDMNQEAPEMVEIRNITKYGLIIVITFMLKLLLSPWIIYLLDLALEFTGLLLVFRWTLLFVLM